MHRVVQTSYRPPEIAVAECYATILPQDKGTGTLEDLCDGASCWSMRSLFAN